MALKNLANKIRVLEIEISMLKKMPKCLADETLLAEDWLSLEDEEAWKDL